MVRTTSNNTLVGQLPEPMQKFIAMVDDELAKTSGNGKKLALVKKALERAEGLAAKFKRRVMSDARIFPHDGIRNAHVDDYTTVIQLLEERKSGVEVALRAEIAAHENADEETPSLLRDLSIEISLNTVKMLRERREAALRYHNKRRAGR